MWRGLERCRWRDAGSRRALVVGIAALDASDVGWVISYYRISNSLMVAKAGTVEAKGLASTEHQMMPPTTNGTAA